MQKDCQTMFQVIIISLKANVSNENLNTVSSKCVETYTHLFPLILNQASAQCL